MAGRNYESMFMDDPRSIAFNFSKVETTFRRIETTFERSQQGELDAIECTNRILCPNCGRQLIKKKLHYIPHEAEIDLDTTYSMNRNLLLISDSPICECGSRIRITTDESNDELLAYVEKTNALIAFLEEAASYE